MSEKLKSLKVQDGPRAKIAVINGKTYTFLKGYRHSALNGWFWLAVAGKTRLRRNDLADKWQVVRAGGVYFAFAQRPFSYQLLDDTVKTPEAPRGWSRLQTAAPSFAFVGPTEEATNEQLRLVLEQHRPSLDAGEVLSKSVSWAIDQAGGDVKALIVPARHLDCRR